MSNSCLQKQSDLQLVFKHCKNVEDRYHLIIGLGKKMPKLSAEKKREENLVKGCQSTMYLHASLKNGVMIFEGEADALISQGLAALLIHVYSEESPETILKCPPAFLEDLQIPSSLSPNRANGLYSLHLKMKQEALKML